MDERARSCLPPALYKTLTLFCPLAGTTGFRIARPTRSLSTEKCRQAPPDVWVFRLTSFSSHTWVRHMWFEFTWVSKKHLTSESQVPIPGKWQNCTINLHLNLDSDFTISLLKILKSDLCSRHHINKDNFPWNKCLWMLRATLFFFYVIMMYMHKHGKPNVRLLNEWLLIIWVPC